MWRVLAVILLSGGLVFNGAGLAGGQSLHLDDPYLIIIGEKLSFERVPNEPSPEEAALIAEQDRLAAEKGEVVIRIRHAAAEATYKIHEVVRGSYEDNFITFTAYEHAGYFPFSHYDYGILVFRRLETGELDFLPWHFHDVYPLKGRGVAGCGRFTDYFDESELAEAGPPKPLLSQYSFSPVVRYNWSDLLHPEDPRLDPYYSEYENFAEWTEEDFDHYREEVLAHNSYVRGQYGEPVYQVDEFGATCKMGPSVEDIISIDWRLSLGPDLARERCKQWQEDYGTDDLSSERSSDEIETCVERELALALPN